VNRRTITRAITFTIGVALGLNLLSGAAFAAPSTEATAGAAAANVVISDSPDAGTPADAKFECSDSHHSDTGNGANNSDGYQSTCDPADFGGNGQEYGPGLQTGKPCAGCVGNADDKNPPGQSPDGSDHNSGYECDGRDRPADNQQGNGNHGIGDENPAHTGCESTATEVSSCPDGAAMPTTDTNGDDAVDAADCSTDDDTETILCPDTENTQPMSDEDGNGIIDAGDCTKDVQTEAETCPDGSVMTDVNDDGVVDATDCITPAPVEEDVVEGVVKDVVVVTEVENIQPVVEEVPVVNAAVVVQDVVPAVLSLTVPQDEVVPEAAVAPRTETSVLGVQVTRGAAPLARTGAADVAAEATVALILLALGFGLVRLGRRPLAA
jgi:hypothetical protein